jgi:predicted metal-dependent phosphoesterase TrpH
MVEPTYEPKKPGEEQVEQLTPAEEKQVEAAGAVSEEARRPEGGLMKIDLHCHSEASADCSTPLSLIPGRCLKRGIRVQAITDHNEIWGAQKLQELVASGEIPDAEGSTVIVGEEVSTQEGEIIGLFLNESIPAGLSAEETVERIKAQGGMVAIPHGFDPLKRWRLKPVALQRIVKEVDIVETFNARVSDVRWNQAAVDWAKEHGLLMCAGSDAHTLADIGSAWVEVPLRPIHSPQDLQQALEGGTPVGKWTHPALAFVYKLWDRTRQRLRV